MWHASVLFINFARIACLPHGLCNGTVSVRPSVCLSSLSTAAAACGGFAAVGPTGRRFQSIAARRVCSRLSMHICSGGTALNSKREQCHVVS